VQLSVSVKSSFKAGFTLRRKIKIFAEYTTCMYDSGGLRSLVVAFPPHDSSDAGSNPAEVVEFLRTEKFREQVLREGF
jgi:hypothetical protein